MARVTVEDCIDKVENRFDLVLLASHRARMISSGAPDHHRARQRQEPGGRVARDRRQDDFARGSQGRPDPLAAEVRRGRRAGARDGAADRGAGGSVDADDTEVAVEHMSEEELLKGLEGLAPPEEQPEPDEE